MLGLYEVIDQKEQPDITPSGDFKRFMVVTFRAACGSVSSIRVPEEKYEAEYVKQELAKKATIMCEIHSS